MSIRNNEDRVGAKPSADPPLIPVENTATTNPSQLSFAVPTEFVDLPSKGRYYPEGHALHNVDNIEIKFMTAKEEDILTSRTLIRKGIAVDRLLSSVILNKNVDIDNLLIGDKNAVIVATRVTGYGEAYNTNINCPVCGLASQYSFDLNNVEVNYGGALNLEGVEETPQGTFKFVLPKSKIAVEIRLLTGKDEKDMQLLAERKKKHNLGSGETTLTDQLRAAIVSVNEITDVASISSFVVKMPAMDSRHIRNIISKVTPNIDMTQVFSCQSCGHEDDMEVPFTADFFWPRQ